MMTGTEFRNYTENSTISPEAGEFICQRIKEIVRKYNHDMTLVAAGFLCSAIAACDAAGLEPFEAVEAIEDMLCEAGVR